MPLEIELRLKEQLSIGEPVLATVVFNNTSKDPVWINTAFNLIAEECSLNFHIQSPSGKTLQQARSLLGKRKPLNADDFIKLKGLGVYETQLNITKLFTLDEIGTYKIFVVYTNNNDGLKFGAKGWRGSLTSGSRTFRIIR